MDISIAIHANFEKEEDEEECVEEEEEGKPEHMSQASFWKALKTISGIVRLKWKGPTQFHYSMFWI